MSSLDSREERAAVEAAPFTPASALSVLTDVSDADAVRLGFTPCAAHPRDLVLCSVLVPPPISRLHKVVSTVRQLLPAARTPIPRLALNLCGSWQG